MLTIGVIREGKVPADFRVPLTPEQCAMIMEKYPIKIIVEPSENRCYTDKEYRDCGVEVASKMDECSILMGVKEVPIPELRANKSYFFFSHTIKEQVYNRELLQKIIEKNIRLMDYEVLTNEQGKRVIAFGRFAGIVGAHNALIALGRTSGAFELKRMCDCHDYAEAKSIYKKLKLPAAKIVLTGTGRVANGAAEVLDAVGIQAVSPKQFLEKNFNGPVYTQLACSDYVAPKSGGPYVSANFYKNGEAYKSIFEPYTKVADVMINGIYWDNKAPAFFTAEEMKSDKFNIKIIADVTCDIAPEASIPSTLFASTIKKPFFGYAPDRQIDTEAFTNDTITMMTIDNLPNEMPRDASKAFGEQFMAHVLGELLKKESEMLERASIAKNGGLGSYFKYLANYVAGSSTKS